MAVPVVCALLYFGRNIFLKRAWLKWGTPSSNAKAMARLQSKPVHRWMGLTGMLLVSFATVNPQWGYKKDSVENKSANIYLLMDISNSMLAEDVAPNRLERAKHLAMDISTAFKTDKTGLILFAGNAYIQSPLTTDWHAIQLYLNAANPDQAGTQGTAIGAAIRLALQINQIKENPDQGALVILTDGEDHDSDALSAVNDAYALGWATYIIGVGTEEGATIPVMINGSKDLKRDETGQPVHTKLNERLMRELAERGHGRYFNIEEKSIVDDLKTEFASLERTQLEKRAFSEHRSYFQWFLLPGILFILGFVALNYKFDVV